MRVIYVSYDGVLDPLGTSQGIPYLLGLTDRGVLVTLISCEKPERWQDSNVRDAQARLEARSIRWCALRYHKRPRLVATGCDILAGSHAISLEAQRSSPVVIHCRGDIAMLMARW